MSTKNQPTHDAFLVKDLGDGKKAKWYPLGAGWENSDGKGISCDTVFGKIVIRERTPKDGEATDQPEDGIAF